MHFDVNRELLEEACEVLWERTNIYWIIGGSSSGKSTLSRELSGRTEIPIYDMDAYVFDLYMGRYNKEKHPANSAWFTAPNPLDWALSLSWEEFDSVYQAANVEYLVLLAEDLLKTEFLGPQIIDGGITHPSVLVKTLKSTQIVCIDTEERTRALTWETSEERSAMKKQVMTLPDGDVKWTRFREFDRLLTRTIIQQSRTENIKIFYRANDTTVEQLGDQIQDYFGI
ncbi:MAG TPA: hypothetical protein VFI27_21980 [candidate division Zixibacteria bacterium]|nr:hypothetical protein [candidate division Zixibacteria bacterium]